MSLERVTRREWNAAGPRRTPRVIAASRRKGVVLHWNGPPVRLDPTAGTVALRRREIATVRAVQRYHQEQNKWSDSAYSYMVGQSGTVYDVRGDDWDQFANGSDSIGVNDGADSDFYTVMVMIGEGEMPTSRAVLAVESIVAHVRELGAGDRVLPHNAFKRKTCPGVELIEVARRLDRQLIAPTFQQPAADGDLELSDWNRGFLDGAGPGSYSAAVELWQRALVASGFDPGPLDGLVGTRTIAANRSFAEAVDEPPADRPSDKVWTALIEAMTAPRRVGTSSRRASRRRSTLRG